jgi:hypothetical protein
MAGLAPVPREEPSRAQQGSECSAVQWPDVNLARPVRPGGGLGLAVPQRAQEALQTPMLVSPALAPVPLPRPMPLSRDGVIPTYEDPRWVCPSTRNANGPGMQADQTRLPMGDEPRLRDRIRIWNCLVWWINAKSKRKSMVSPASSMAAPDAGQPFRPHQSAHVDVLAGPCLVSFLEGDIRVTRRTQSSIPKGTGPHCLRHRPANSDDR